MGLGKETGEQMHVIVQWISTLKEMPRAGLQLGREKSVRGGVRSGISA